MYQFEQWRKKRYHGCKKTVEGQKDLNNKLTDAEMLHAAERNRRVRWWLSVDLLLLVTILTCERSRDPLLDWKYRLISAWNIVYIHVSAPSYPVVWHPYQKQALAYEMQRRRGGYRAYWGSQSGTEGVVVGLMAPRCLLALWVNIMMSDAVSSGPGWSVSTLFFWHWAVSFSLTQAIIFPTPVCFFAVLPPHGLSVVWQKGRQKQVSV